MKLNKIKTVCGGQAVQDSNIPHSSRICLASTQVQIQLGARFEALFQCWYLHVLEAGRCTYLGTWAYLFSLLWKEFHHAHT